MGIYGIHVLRQIDGCTISEAISKLWRVGLQHDILDGSVMLLLDVLVQIHQLLSNVDVIPEHVHIIQVIDIMVIGMLHENLIKAGQYE